MKNQFNLSISILLLLLLFSVLIISCNQKNCCNGKHIVSSSDCCFFEDNRIEEEVTGFANENEVDEADVAIETVNTCLTLEKNIYTFESGIINNGGENAYSVVGIILLPPNAKVISREIKLHKGNQIPKTIENHQCGGKITFCIDTLEIYRNPLNKISIKIVATKSASPHAMDHCKFGIFAYNQIPDLHMENNYWTTNILKDCLNK